MQEPIWSHDKKKGKDVHTRLTGMQLAEVFLQVRNTPCWKVHMPTKKYD